MKKSGSIAALALGAITVTAVSSVSLEAQTQKSEKCYGIVAKGQNDCANSKHSCAGGAKTDSLPDEWLYVPAGLCERIAGGKKEA